QHNPAKPRSEHGIPLGPAGTLFVMGDLKKMTSRYLVGVSLLGYGCSLSVGLGIPIPILNEEMARFCGVADEELLAPIVDYSTDYPAATGRILGQVSYAQLKRGSLTLGGQEVPTVPLSSLTRAREIALLLKEWISKGQFLLGEPVELLPGSEAIHNIRTGSRDS
ncbi:MAG: homocysteine biosynthesis protein, partial [Desulfobaccales bacterium]